MFSSHNEILWENENCVDNSHYNPGGSVELLPCHGLGGNQKWIHDKQSVCSLKRSYDLDLFGCNKRVSDTFLILQCSMIKSHSEHCLVPVSPK